MVESKKVLKNLKTGSKKVAERLKVKKFWKTAVESKKVAEKSENSWKQKSCWKIFKTVVESKSCWKIWKPAVESKKVAKKSENVIHEKIIFHLLKKCDLVNK